MNHLEKTAIKKYISPAFFAAAVLMSSGCRTTSTKTAAANAASVTSPAADDGIQTTDFAQPDGQETSVTGLLKTSTQSLILIQEPMSRSRCDITLIAPDKETKDKLIRLNDKTVTLTGTYTQIKSPWNKTMLVSSIVRER